MSTFTRKHYVVMAKLIDQQRTSVPATHEDFGPHWTTVYETALAMGQEFAADSERFNAEKFFTACGFGVGPVQTMVNRCGQVLKGRK